MSGDGAELFFVDAIRQALHQEMERDERVFVLGEDVGADGGAQARTTSLAALLPDAFDEASLSR